MFDGPVDDPAAFERDDRQGRGRRRWSAAREALAGVEPFTSPRRSRRSCATSSSARGAKPGQVFQPIRVALAGQTVSPGIFETIALLGREETLARIDAALRTSWLRWRGRQSALNRDRISADRWANGCGYAISAAPAAACARARKGSELTWPPWPL